MQTMHDTLIMAINLLHQKNNYIYAINALIHPLPLLLPPKI